jgi:alpha-maltose-1-phosphate synthase
LAYDRRSQRCGVHRWHDYSMTEMVCVGSPGRFHTFDLGRELEARKLLRRIYTAYPRSRVDRSIVSRTRSRSRVLLAREALRRWGLARAASAVDPLFQRSFDRWMACNLEPCDVFHCLSGFGLAAHAVAKERFGALTVCDRGSTHIESQHTLLREEHDRWGVKFAGIPRSVVTRELAEYELCDAIVVPSTHARRSFLDQGVPPHKVHRVPFGVDLELFRPVETLSPPRFTVLFVGTICVRKGIGYLLEALHDEAGRGELDIWLAGEIDPAARPILRRFEGTFRYLGHVPRTQLAGVYSRASLLVLPSVEEGLALVLAQAMACGLPVIATTNTGVEDLVTDGVEGFVVSIRNPAAIADRVDELRRDAGLLQSMRAAAQHRSRSFAGWTSYGDSIVGMYRSLLAARQ